eukprot:TRINITY_DN6792_c0_g1_i1.p2 TRINITY_DN6792_c0_g1~~TRINITY_DN6792_c0_g1_i1.p2  ORF type:complete len:158 (+),score=26.21 TRINITY_DN6792_c0_g1_i1:625-1098(+)
MLVDLIVLHIWLFLHNQTTYEHILKNRLLKEKQLNEHTGEQYFKSSKQQQKNKIIMQVDIQKQINEKKQTNINSQYESNYALESVRDNFDNMNQTANQEMRQPKIGVKKLAYLSNNYVDNNNQNKYKTSFEKKLGLLFSTTFNQKNRKHSINSQLSK